MIVVTIIVRAFIGILGAVFIMEFWMVFPVAFPTFFVVLRIFAVGIMMAVIARFFSRPFLVPIHAVLPILVIMMASVSIAALRVLSRAG